MTFKLTYSLENRYKCRVIESRRLQTLKFAGRIASHAFRKYERLNLTL